MKNNLKNFKSFFYSYVDLLNEKINKLSLEDLFKAVKIIESTIKKKKIYLCMWQWRICSNCRSLYL